MRFKQTFLKIKSEIQRLQLQYVTYFSAQASFYMIVSIFPFLILLITLSAFLPESFTATVSSVPPHILPEALKGFAQGLVEEARDSDSGTLLIVVSSVTAIWSASKGTLSLIRGLDFFYNFTEKGGWIYKRVKACVFTFFIAVLILVVFFLLVIWEWLWEMLLSLLDLQYLAVSDLLSYRLLISLTVLTFAFMLVFSFMPGKRTSMKRNFWGALLSAAGWIGFSAGFSIYVSNFSLTVYGSLTTIVLFMLWLYFCISILFIGAVFNRYLEQKREQKKTVSS